MTESGISPFEGDSPRELVSLNSPSFVKMFDAFALRATVAVGIIVLQRNSYFAKIHYELNNIDEGVGVVGRRSGRPSWQNKRGPAPSGNSLNAQVGGQCIPSDIISLARVSKYGPGGRLLKRNMFLAWLRILPARGR